MKKTFLKFSWLVVNKMFRKIYVCNNNKNWGTENKKI